MLKIVDHWFKMSVDGLRLDAIPYLYERENTNCENLPETHVFLKKLRAHVDKHYRDRLLLAEANQLARGRGGVFRRRRRMPHGFPLSAYAAAVHGDPDGGQPAHHRHVRAHAAYSGKLPVGLVPAKSRRTDAGNGDGFRTRLHVRRLRPGSAGARQSRHPTPTRTAARKQSPQRSNS